MSQKPGLRPLAWLVKKVFGGVLFAKFFVLRLNSKMCVQFMSNKSLTDLAKEFSAKVDEPFEWKPHVFPKYPAPVLIESKGKLLITKMNFGLIPFFEKNEKPKMIFHNARVETIAEKPSFKKAFQTQRCVIPLSSFFEYIWEDDKNKWVANFSEKTGKTLVAAGIWNAWRSPSGIVLNTFTMITREPPKFILEVGHDRSPFFIEHDASAQWISPGVEEPADLFKTLQKIKVEPEFALA